MLLGFFVTADSCHLDCDNCRCAGQRARALLTSGNVLLKTPIQISLVSAVLRIVLCPGTWLERAVANPRWLFVLPERPVLHSRDTGRSAVAVYGPWIYLFRLHCKNLPTLRLA